MPSSRERDLSFEKLAEVCGIDIGSLSGQSRGMLNRALGQMREVTPDLDDAELAMVIEGKAASYRKVMGDAILTPTALAKHWAQLEGLVAQQQAQAQRVNAYVDPSRCDFCGGARMVLAYYRPAGGSHPSHRTPQDGYEAWAPCPACNQPALAIANEYRERFDRFHPPRPRAGVSSNTRTREEG